MSSAGKTALFRPNQTGTGSCVNLTLEELAALFDTHGQPHPTHSSSPLVRSATAVYLYVQAAISPRVH